MSVPDPGGRSWGSWRWAPQVPVPCTRVRAQPGSCAEGAVGPTGGQASAPLQWPLGADPCLFCSKRAHQPRQGGLSGPGHPRAVASYRPDAADGRGGRSRKRLSCAGRTAIRQQSGPPRLAPQVLPQLGPGSGWSSPAHSRQGTYPVAPPGSEGGMGPSSRIFPSACPHPAGHWSSQQPLPALWGHRWSTRGCCPLLPTKLSIRLVGITGSPGVNRKQYK